MCVRADPKTPPPFRMRSTLRHRVPVRKDLISAADVNVWLERTGLTTDDWMAYLNRDLLRERWSDDLEEILDRFAPSARQLVAAAMAEGICSGIFDTFEQAFAGRAAFVLERDAAQFQGACLRNGSPSADASVARLAQTHAHWLSMRPAADTALRLSTVSELEEAFRRLADVIASNDRMSEVVDAHRVEWMQLEVDTVSFTTETAAREAILRQEDGLSRTTWLPCPTVWGRTTVALEDVDVRHRDQLLAAEPGHLLGPLRSMADSTSRRSSAGPHRRSPIQLSPRGHDRRSSTQPSRTLLASTSRGEPGTNLSLCYPRHRPNPPGGRGGLTEPGVLDDLPILRFLPDDTRALVVRQFVTASFPFGGVIVSEGEATDALFVLVSGRARVIKRAENGDEIPLNMLRAGDSFGEVELLDGARRPTTVRASSDVIALRLERSAFQHLVDRAPDIRTYLELQTKHRQLQGFFRGFPAFARLPAEAVVGIILAELEPCEVEAGAVIVRPGDPPGPMLIERKRSIFREAASAYVASLGAGEYFGEIAALGGIPRARPSKRSPPRG